MLFLPVEFFPSLKRLLGTLVFCLFLCVSILRFNAVIGQITYTPKYMEQQFGLSTSRANFLVGKKEHGSIARGLHCPLVEDGRIDHKPQPQIAVTQNIVVLFIDVVRKGYNAKVNLIAI